MPPQIVNATSEKMPLWWSKQPSHLASFRDNNDIIPIKLLIQGEFKRAILIMTVMALTSRKRKEKKRLKPTIHHSHVHSARLGSNACYIQFCYVCVKIYIFVFVLYIISNFKVGLLISSSRCHLHWFLL